MKDKNSDWGFTLLELLVVVLIIGILAAIALPQYQKIITKSKAAQMYDAVSSFAKSSQIFYMTNGSYPIKFDDLDITWNLKKINTSVCVTNTKVEVLQQDNFEFVIDSGFSGNPYKIITARFRNGPYKCTGFSFLLYYPTNPNLENRLLCYERLTHRGTKNQQGDFCNKIMGYESYFITPYSTAFYF